MHTNEAIVAQFDARQLAFLAQASQSLAASLDVEQTVATMARLPVPFLANACAIDLIEGELVRRAAVHATPEAEHLARLLRLTSGSVPATPAWGITQGAATLTLPLHAHGTAIAAVTLVASPERPYASQELALAQSLAERCAAALHNARLYHQAQELAVARGQLFDIIAHDLKNPLTVVLGTVQLLTRRTQRLAELDETLVQRLGQIGTSAEEMRAILDDLLDLSRLSAGQTLELTRSPADLAAVVRRVVAEHQPPRGRHPITLDAPMRELSGVFDTLRIERALTSLLAGAAHASVEGQEIVVRIRRDEQENGSWARIAVGDGNAQGDRNHANNVGLLVARQIIEQHGGRLDAWRAEQEAMHVVELPLV
jgi:K+-sensing histidine kinase KdpD